MGLFQPIGSKFGEHSCVKKAYILHHCWLQLHATGKCSIWLTNNYKKRLIWMLFVPAHKCLMVPKGIGAHSSYQTRKPTAVSGPTRRAQIANGPGATRRGYPQPSRNIAPTSIKFRSSSLGEAFCQFLSNITEMHEGDWSGLRALRWQAFHAGLQRYLPTCLCLNGWTHHSQACSSIWIISFLTLMCRPKVES